MKTIYDAKVSGLVSSILGGMEVGPQEYRETFEQATARVRRQAGRGGVAYTDAEIEEAEEIAKRIAERK